MITAFALFLGSASGVSASYFRGVNLFGGWQEQYGGVDTFPGPTLLDYLKAKGLTTFRVGFSWVHLQPSLMGPFDSTYLAKMDTLVADAKARGEQVAFVPLPGQYNGNDVATSAVSQAAFNDMWIKLATHYKNETAIWGYDLINEPNMGDTWNTNIAPSVIAAIRTVDMTHPIIVPTSTGGYGHYFTSHLAGLPMTDPANNLIYEAHFYFDNPPNGQYVNGYDAGTDYAIGVEHAQGFVNWCNTNNQRCYVGEYGIPGGWTHGDTTCLYDGGSNSDSRWLTIMDNFLTYLDQNNISATYWETGPYGDINSMGPFCDTAGNWSDGPQVSILEKHLGSNATTGPTATPHPTVAPTPAPLPGDANGDKKVDNADYNIWLSHYGENARGGSNGDFNNDGTVDGIDFVIWVLNYNAVIQATPGPTVTPGPSSGSSILGSNMVMTSGTGQVNGSDLEILTNGTAVGMIHGPVHKLVISARGDICSGSPHINLKINGNYVLDQNIDATSLTNYTTNDLTYMGLGNQDYTVEVDYNNDYFSSTCNRNVYVHSIIAQ